MTSASSVCTGIEVSLACPKYYVILCVVYKTFDINVRSSKVLNNKLICNASDKVVKSVVLLYCLSVVLVYFIKQNELDVGKTYFL